MLLSSGERAHNILHIDNSLAIRKILIHESDAEGLAPIIHRDLL